MVHKHSLADLVEVELVRKLVVVHKLVVADHNQGLDRRLVLVHIELELLRKLVLVLVHKLVVVGILLPVVLVGNLVDIPVVEHTGLVVDRPLVGTVAWGMAVVVLEQQLA